MEQAVGRIATNSVEVLQQVLTVKYGPLLRHDQVADVLSVSPKSLHNTLRRSQAPNVLYLNLKKLRFGRRVRYQAISVAEALTLDPEELKRRLAAWRNGGSDSGKRRRK
ncbi:MAG TPA: hypothetical protein VFG91_03870 [Woeseiaceae bacterium]|nr:hypothetical protein [Woeseiaceae bacterium]